MKLNSKGINPTKIFMRGTGIVSSLFIMGETKDFDDPELSKILEWIEECYIYSNLELELKKLTVY